MRRRNKIALLIFFPLGAVFLAQTQVQSGATNQSPPAAAAGSQSNTAPLAPSGVQSVPQNPEDSSESGVYVFRKQVEEVVLHATVIDDKQRIITSLDKSDFTVYEDNQKVEISYFTALTKAPLRYDRAARELISDEAGLAYPIRDGIPIMLVDEARTLRDGEATPRPPSP